ncbi:hypothetical protein KJ785_02830 [Patescibacteria group bacterium]|nr:hypothetical protein [Patescibacteria group bacterium]
MRVIGLWWLRMNSVREADPSPLWWLRMNSVREADPSPLWWLRMNSVREDTIHCTTLLTLLSNQGQVEFAET